MLFRRIDEPPVVADRERGFIRADGCEVPAAAAIKLILGGRDEREVAPVEPLGGGIGGGTVRRHRTAAAKLHGAERCAVGDPPVGDSLLEFLVATGALVGEVFWRDEPGNPGQARRDGLLAQAQNVRRWGVRVLSERRGGVRQFRVRLQARADRVDDCWRSTHLEPLRMQLVDNAILQQRRPRLRRLRAQILSGRRAVRTRAGQGSQHDESSENHAYQRTHPHTSRPGIRRLNPCSPFSPGSARGANFFRERLS